MMHKYKDYWEAIVGDEVKESEMEEIVCEALEKLKWHCPELYYKALYCLHTVAFGEHFDESLAKKAVSEMLNVDGTVGEHWTFEQTSTLAEQQGIKCKADWYYVLNMLWSDYSNVLGSDVSMYARLAKAYVDDPDANKGKAFNTWFWKRAMKRK